MKTLKKLLVITVAVILASIKPVLADTIGYADFKKIESNYSYAQKVYKDLDDKVLELQQYLINKDKEYKAIESPLSKKNFEEKTEKEYKAKEDAVLKLKLQKEEEIGSHEYQSGITSKNNEEYNRRVKVYSEKYKLPKKAVDGE